MFYVCYAKIVIYVNFVWDILLSCVEFIGESGVRGRNAVDFVRLFVAFSLHLIQW